MSSSSQLAAIMFTDIVGYTALMGKDSNKAMELVRLSKDIQKPLVEKHQGKWIKEMGDGVIAQFNTALDAVNCAVEINGPPGPTSMRTSALASIWATLPSRTVTYTVMV